MKPPSEHRTGAGEERWCRVGLILHLHIHCSLVKAKRWAPYSCEFSSLFQPEVIRVSQMGRQGRVWRCLDCRWQVEESQRHSKSSQDDWRGSWKLRQPVSVLSSAFSVCVVGSCMAVDG